MSSGTMRAYANTPYGQIHYRYAGEGEPLVMLHQTACGSAQYDEVIPLLAPKCRVMAMDTPGFGMSDQPPHPYTAADYARCIVAFFDAMGLQRPNLFAHHTGATYACEVAAAYPDRVDKLILYGTPHWEETAEQLITRLEGRALVIKKDGSHLNEVWDDMYGRLLDGVFPDRASKEALDAVETEVIWKLVSGPRFADAYHAIFRYPVLERVPLIKAPTLVMSGTGDTLVHTTDLIAKHIPRSRTAVIQGGSFYTSYDNPQELAKEMLGFLESPGV